MGKDNFYCQKLCVNSNFSIQEWNTNFMKLSQAGLLETKAADEILNPELSPCEEQCVECAVEVGKRRIKTKNNKV